MNPPSSVIYLNESGFEALAQHYYNQLGEVTIENLNIVLQELGF